jgi:hypothetical protein
MSSRSANTVMAASNGEFSMSTGKTQDAGGSGAAASAVTNLAALTV